MLAAVGSVNCVAHAQDAKTVLQKALKTIGDVQSIQYSGSGHNFELGQNVRPTTPWTKLIITRYTQTIDYGARSSKEELTRINETPPSPGGGGLFAGEQKQVNIVSGEYAWNQPADKPQPALLLLPAIEISTARLRQLQIWLTPHGFLKAAAQNNATSRQEGGSTIVSFTLDKFKVSGAIDGRNLVTKVDTWIPNAVLGDMIIETTYSGYKDFGDVKFPTHIVQRQGEFPVLDLNVSDVRPNAPFTLTTLTVPDAVKQMRPPSDSVVETHKLADGVWYLTGAFVDSVVIEYPSYLAVIEAPLSEERSLAVIAEAKKLAPNKPIRYVLNTHHHFDHAAAPLLVERAINHGGEMIKIDRFILGLGRLGNEFVGRRLVELEFLLNQGAQLAALGVGDVAVDGGGMDEQRRRGEAVVIVLEVGGMLVAVRHLGQKLAEALEHGAYPGARHVACCLREV